MKEKLKILELFSGIRAFSTALERLGIEYECVDSVEIDKYAIKSQNAMFGTNFEPQDITQWDKDIKVDLIMHGSPCQDFSLAGKQVGGDKDSGTRSSLMYETIRIVKKLKPKYVIWENVKNLLSKKHRHNFDAYLETMKQLGYSNYYQVLNAKDYGIPQNRERVFTVSIRNDVDKDGIEILDIFNFPNKIPLKLTLKDMLEENADEKYYLSEKMLSFFIRNSEEQKQKGNGFRFTPKDGSGTAKSITTLAGNRMDDNFVYVPEATKRGYKEAYEGDSVNLEQPKSLTRRGRVGQQIAQTLTTSCNQAVVEPFITKKYKEFKKDKGYTPNMFNPYNKAEINDIAPTQSTQCGSTTSSATVLIKNDLKIRKLTPKECWRLMGFDDPDFEKAEEVNSNAQLYKQAGNSIVVNVLEAILKELFKEDQQ